jgi:hypothetical protein
VNIKKIITAWAIFAALVAVDIWAANDNKVPAEIGVRITKNLLDQSRIQNQMYQLQNQYTADQQTIQHDQAELDNLKKEALTAAQKDPAGWDVNVETLEFVAKPKAAPEVKK